MTYNLISILASTIKLPLRVDNVKNEVDASVFENLLGGKSFQTVRNQIIFKSEGKYYISVIDNQRFRYNSDYYNQLPEGAPFQLINGKLIFMASPKDIHQSVLGNLYLEITPFVKKNKLGKVRLAPLDVHFDKNNICQPDLMFISNERKDILKDFVFGAPDLSVEIISKGTRKNDENEKKETYGKFGVLEYWLIDPINEEIDIYLNENNSLILKQSYSKNGLVQSKTVSGFSFELGDLFEE